MASDDGNSLLEIPGAWISKELDLDLPPPSPLTPPASIQPAYTRTVSEELPIPCDPLQLSPPASILVHSTLRTSYNTLGHRKSDRQVEMATFVIPARSKTAAEVTPQSTLSLLDGASNASSAFLPYPIDAPSSRQPGVPPEMLSGDTTSIHSGVTGLSFGPSGSPLSKCNSDYLEYKELASHDSLHYSVIDTSPSSASINIVPSIPSIASDLNLHNFPISDGQPIEIEPHSAYFSAVEGDLSMSQRSDDELDAVHETSTTSGSASDLCIPTAEEAHHQIFWQENPSPRRPTVRIEVRNNVLRPGEQVVIRQESFTYACKSLPYDAGFRPHAYVDNHEYTTHGKHRPESLVEDLYAMEESMEGDHVMDKSEHPTIFRKFVGGKRMSKLLALGPLKSQKTPKRSSAHSCTTHLLPSVVLPSVRSSADRSLVTADYPDGSNRPPTLSPSSPSPSFPISNKTRTRALFRKTWSGPRPLSIFVVPKPRVEGRVAPSPRELPMYFPPDENPPPFSSPTSPQLHDAQIPETDVHGRSYGPSRVASPDLSPDPSIFRRKGSRS